MYTQNKFCKTYTPEFKILIVNKYLSGEYTVPQLSNEYDIHTRLIRKWVTKFQLTGTEGLRDHRGQHGKHAGGRPKNPKYANELEQLRQENLRLKGENFLLKKLKELLDKHER